MHSLAAIASSTSFSLTNRVMFNKRSPPPPPPPALALRHCALRVRLGENGWWLPEHCIPIFMEHYIPVFMEHCIPILIKHYGVQKASCVGRLNNERNTYVAPVDKLLPT
jgi:hypothetical protein